MPAQSSGYRVSVRISDYIVEQACGDYIFSDRIEVLILVIEHRKSVYDGH
jgi:hypothetical protein